MSSYETECSQFEHVINENTKNIRNYSILVFNRIIS